MPNYRERIHRAETVMRSRREDRDPDKLTRIFRSFGPIFVYASIGVRKTYAIVKVRSRNRFAKGQTRRDLRVTFRCGGTLLRGPAWKY
jgi:hypothetical protein